MKQLILGGARSGKSKLAEHIASESGLAVIYVATAQCLDQEMERRVALHQSRRPEHWSLIEEPVKLAQVVQEHGQPGKLILIDCLTLWLSNLLHVDTGQHFKTEMDAFLQALSRMKGDVVLVSNEVGMGIVPMGELSRQFQDESGWMHQAVAEVCDKVIFTVAGLPHVLKG